MRKCASCNHSFGDLDSKRQHLRATGHCFCPHCDRFFCQQSCSWAARTTKWIIIRLSVVTVKRNFPWRRCSSSISVLQANAFVLFVIYSLTTIVVSAGTIEQTTRLSVMVVIKDFAKEDSLKRHQRDTGHCFCSSCNKSFINGHALTWHNTRRHTFPCPECGKVFPQDIGLKAHQRRTAHCYCPPCERPFARASTLEAHDRAVHSFPCRTCSKIFGQESALRQHQCDSRALQILTRLQEHFESQGT